MPRTLYLAAALALAGLAAAPAARAGVVFSLTDASSSSITSGDSFTFAIRMSGAGVAGYQVPVVIAGPSASLPGTDFNVPEPSMPSSGYVFSSSGGFAATVSTDARWPTGLLLTVGDNSADNSETDGSADLIAWVTVTTSSTFEGLLTVNFGPVDDFVAADGSLNDVGFQRGNGFSVQVGRGGAVIPEPASVVMLSLGGLTVAGLGLARRGRRSGSARA